MADTWRNERDRFEGREWDDHGEAMNAVSRQKLRGGEARRRYEMMLEERDLKDRLNDFPFDY